jgi:hypothetical protein
LLDQRLEFRPGTLRLLDENPLHPLRDLAGMRHARRRRSNGFALAFRRLRQLNVNRVFLERIAAEKL